MKNKKPDLKELFKILFDKIGTSEKLNLEIGIQTRECEKEDLLFINVHDKQAVGIRNGKFKFYTVGGSRYCWLETFDNAKDCADFILKNIYYHTSEKINKEYRAIWHALTKCEEA